MKTQVQTNRDNIKTSIKDKETEIINWREAGRLLRLELKQLNLDLIEAEAQVEAEEALAFYRRYKVFSKDLTQLEASKNSKHTANKETPAAQ